jgi:hypothetical protein
LNPKIFKSWLFILFGIIWMIPDGQAINVTVTGDWTLVIDENDLQDGPGSDLNPQYPSATDQISVDITQTGKNWTVYIQGSITNWYSGLSVYVRRTSDGSGNGWISGGTNWMQVTLGSQQFFQGNKRRLGIHVQCGLTGMSVQVPPDTYSGTITYTVVEN